MIADRIDAYLRGAPRALEPAWLDALAAAAARTAQRNFGVPAEPEVTRARISASSPWYCPRRMVYSADGAPREPLAPRARQVFALGDVVEALVVVLARAAGVSMESPTEAGEQMTYVADLAGVPVPAHPDMVVGGVPVEIKSMADRGYERFSRQPDQWREEESYGYVAQLHVQMIACDVDHGYIVAAQKSTMHVAEMRVARDPNIEATLVRAARGTEQHLADGTMPERPSWARVTSRGELEHWRCRYCPFVETCWPEGRRKGAKWIVPSA